MHPLQGGILKPPALRVVDDLGAVEVRFLSLRCRGDARSPLGRLTLKLVKRERKAVTPNPPAKSRRAEWRRGRYTNALLNRCHVRQAYVGYWPGPKGTWRKAGHFFA